MYYYNDIYKSYNNQMQMHDFIRRIDGLDGRRWYSAIKTDHEGKEHPLWCYKSFTTMIDTVYPKDSYLINWIREQGQGGQAIFEKAAEEGTEAHIAIERLINGDLVETVLMSDKVKKCVQAFINWTEEFKPKFLSVEEIVYSDALKLAGTRDLLCELNYVKGKTQYVGRYVVDFKTSNSIQEKHKVQVAGYWSCGTKWSESPKTDDKTAILHLNAKTKSGYTFSEFDPYPYFAQLVHFNQTFKMMYPDAAPKVIEYPDKFELPKELTIKS
jgi:hypothetical protein